MARKLKTYITSIGFFEEAVAVPSMKAALEAWGSGHNLFHQGFAEETNDPAIIAATMKQPGIVLKRPVGTQDPFKIQARLPNIKAINKMASKATKKNKTQPVRKLSKKFQDDVRKQERKAAIAYEREMKRREKQRLKDEAARKRAEERRKVAVAKAQLELNKAKKRHNQTMGALKEQLAIIQNKIEVEEAKWDALRQKLEAAIEKANS